MSTVPSPTQPARVLLLLVGMVGHAAAAAPLVQCPDGGHLVGDAPRPKKGAAPLDPSANYAPVRQMCMAKQADGRVVTHGPTFDWYPDGTPMCRSEWTWGTLTGTATCWYVGGAVRSEQHLDDGGRVAWSVEYDRSGAVTRRTGTPPVPVAATADPTADSPIPGPASPPAPATAAAPAPTVPSAAPATPPAVPAPPAASATEPSTLLGFRDVECGSAGPKAGMRPTAAPRGDEARYVRWTDDLWIGSGGTLDAIEYKYVAGKFAGVYATTTSADAAKVVGPALVALLGEPSSTRPIATSEWDGPRVHVTFGLMPEWGNRGVLLWDCKVTP